MHESILIYKRGRYFWFSVGLCAASIAAYAWHQPAEPPNGGTWLGYTLGGLALFIILLLTYFGIRKRSYGSNVGRVEGWLSAHVYLGLSLIIIATLHTGFQFGWNIHTVAYVLMCLVISSGVFGVFAYLHYPHLQSENRRHETREKMLDDVATLDKKITQKAQVLDQALQTLLVSSTERTMIGGGAMAQMLAFDHSKVILSGELCPGKQETLVTENQDQSVVLDVLIDKLSKTTDEAENSQFREITDLVKNKKDILKRMKRDIQIQALLEIWLYIHVPLTFMLLGALTAHIVSVFFYW